MPIKSLVQNLADVEPRERGGSRGSAGFSYQKLWAICEIVDRHERGVDYVAIFDFHDDFVLVLPDTDELHFYQVKKRDDGKLWTLPQLLHRKKLKSGGHERSIMAKLVEHQIRFAGAAASINFISNARFNLKLHDSSKSTERDAVCVVEISAADRGTIRAQLAGEHDPATAGLRGPDSSAGDRSQRRGC